MSQEAGSCIWTWANSPEKKAAEITVSADGLVASRNAKAGKNPSVVASNPLTKQCCHFRIEIRKLGGWFGIGVVDHMFRLSGSKTIGTQETGVNVGYFWQSSGIHRLQMHGEQPVEVQEIRPGDIIDIKVDYAAQRVYFYNNEQLQGFIASTKHMLKEGRLRACVNMSANTEVALRNEGLPVTVIGSLVRDWKWSLTKRAPAITVSKDGLAASRATAPKGMNPAVLAQNPLSRAKSHFRVEVVKLGKWCGIGVADEVFALNDSKTLGTQAKGVNSAYFYQNTGISRLQMHGENSIDISEHLHAGDLIDVQIDFDKNRIYYFRNENLQGYIAPTQNIIQEGKVYPCVGLSANTELVFRNADDGRVPDIHRKIARLANQEDAQTWQRPRNQFPTKWQWDRTPQRKADAISVSADGLVARREAGGSNPGVMASEPLTRNSWYFMVEVLSIGSWVGIGIADERFKLNGSKTLGQQTNGVNSAYFFQAGSIQKLQMHNESGLSDVARVNPGDFIAVKVDFDESRIYYFNNDMCQGCLNVEANILQEGKIFPCVDMSTGTEIAFRNVDHVPITVQECRWWPNCA